MFYRDWGQHWTVSALLGNDHGVEEREGVWCRAAPWLWPRGGLGKWEGRPKCRGWEGVSKSKVRAPDVGAITLVSRSAPV